MSDELIKELLMKCQRKDVKFETHEMEWLKRLAKEAKVNGNEYIRQLIRERWYIRQLNKDTVE